MEGVEIQPLIGTETMQIEDEHGVSHDRNSVALDSPTPSVRAASPSLAVLVSKFECLDTIANSGETPSSGPAGSVSITSRSRRMQMPASNTPGPAVVAPPLSDTTNMQKGPMPRVNGLGCRWGNAGD